MPSEGPEIERLLRRLAECPGEFLATANQRPDYIAIICDHLRTITPSNPPELHPTLARIRKEKPVLLELLAITCWMLQDDWFLARRDAAAEMWKLLGAVSLEQLVELIKPSAFVNDADRREELARVCLKSLSLVPKGETSEQAADRLNALDSVERHRVLKATAAAERRAREVREAMVQKKAQESASRFGE
jgi:hypothetical protein